MFGALPMSIVERKDLTHADIRVLLTLASHADKTGKAWPSALSMATRLHMSRSTVMASLGRCVRLGLLTRDSRSERGLKIASVYTLQFDRFDSQRTAMSEKSTTMSCELDLGCPPRDTTLPSQRTQTNQQTNQKNKPKTRAPRKKRTPVRDNPPTLDEIQTYAAEYGDKHRIGVNERFALKFANYYTEEWVFKTGKPVMNWKQAAGRWILGDADKNRLPLGHTNPRPGQRAVARPPANNFGR